MVEVIADHPLKLDGPVTRLFRAIGIGDFGSAAQHLLSLPYGRITDRNRFWLVLAEGRGTCTTKHATLAALAREQHLDLQLMLGIYEMSERNTPGVGVVLARLGPSRSSASCTRRQSPSSKSDRTRSSSTGRSFVIGSRAPRSPAA